MSTQLLEIQPKELEFIFELKKQSSCSVHLSNNTHHHVAFKVKTTSPKKYCVRPNVGIVMPKSTYEFTVIMQAQRTVPPDMVCKDKFLIQSTIVPPVTTDEEITTSMFTKDGGKYIEENKLRVVLISPPNSSILAPINAALEEGLVHEVSELKVQNGSMKKEMNHITSQLKHRSGTLKDGLVNGDSKLKDENGTWKEGLSLGSLNLEGGNKASNDGLTLGASKVEDDRAALKEGVAHGASNLKDENPALKEGLTHGASDLKDENAALKNELAHGAPTLKDQLLSRDNILPPPQKVSGDVESEVVNAEESKLIKCAELKQAEKEAVETTKDLEELKLVRDIGEMKLKLNELESKLGEAQLTISKLTEDRRKSIQETKFLKDRLMELSNRGVRKVHDGFPPLFVCMVALICTVLGYLWRQ